MNTQRASDLACEALITLPSSRRSSTIAPTESNDRAIPEPRTLAKACAKCKKKIHTTCPSCRKIAEHHQPCPACKEPLEHHDESRIAQCGEGRARMADAKRAAGFELNDVEREALARFPNPRTLTIEGYR